MNPVVNFLTKTYKNIRTPLQALKTGTIISVVDYLGKEYLGIENTLEQTLTVLTNSTLLYLLTTQVKQPTQQAWNTFLHKKIKKARIQEAELNLSALLTTTTLAGIGLANNIQPTYIETENTLTTILLYAQTGELIYSSLKSIDFTLHPKKIMNIVKPYIYQLQKSSEKEYLYLEKRMKQGKNIPITRLEQLQNEYSGVLGTYLKTAFTKQIDTPKKDKQKDRRKLLALDKCEPIHAFVSLPQLELKEKEQLLHHYFYQATKQQETIDLDHLIALSLYANNRNMKEKKTLLKTLGKRAYENEHIKKRLFAKGAQGVYVLYDEISGFSIEQILLEKNSLNKQEIVDEYILSELLHDTFQERPKRHAPIVFNLTRGRNLYWFNLLLIHQQPVHDHIYYLPEEHQKQLYNEIFDFQEEQVHLLTKQSKVKLKEMNFKKNYLEEPLLENKEYEELTKEFIHYIQLTPGQEVAQIDGHLKNYLTGYNYLVSKSQRNKKDEPYFDLTTIDHANKNLGPAIFNYVNPIEFSFDKIGKKQLQNIRKKGMQHYNETYLYEDCLLDEKKLLNIYLLGTIGRRDRFTKAFLKQPHERSRILPFLVNIYNLIDETTPYTSQKMQTYFQEQRTQTKNIIRAILSGKIPN